MTTSEALRSAYEKLDTITANPHLEAEMLLAAVIKKPREFFFSHPEHELTKPQLTTYNLQLKKRLKGVPLAYLTGEKEFYGLTFKVDKNVLVPRPETELMVDEALFHITHNTQRITLPGTTIIDIGAGSGCVIISAIKQLLNNKFPISNFQFFGIDKSDAALSIAKNNAKFHKVDKLIKFMQGNLLEPMLKFLDPRLHGDDTVKNEHEQILVLANLPYLMPEQIKNSPTIKHEPKLALVAGKDGLKYYRELFKQLEALCVTCYALCEVCIMCEIDPTQKTSMARLIKLALPGWKYEIKKDLRGHSRLAIVTHEAGGN